MRLLLHVCCAAMVAGTTPAFAQNAIQPEPMGATLEAPIVAPATELPPDRVGRVSFVSGNPELRGLGGAGWATAELNWPVFTGEALRTVPHSRSEIEIGADTIALSDGSAVEITSLRDRVTQITLSHGRIGIRLRQAGEDESVEVYVPQGGVRLLGPGSYDVDTENGDQTTQISVFEGKAQFAGANSDIPIAAGQTVVLKDPDATAATIQPVTPDDFVEWCRGRDYREATLAAPYYISPRMTGFAALDSAGTWKITSDYGAVWFPSVSEDWAPYRFGHWRWVAPWGWTWVDDQSWGFAPSHYGRWVLIDDHWAWAPGSFMERPIYAPAIVAFLGTRGVGLSSEDGATVAWFPLAPGEAYWPSYGRDVDYVRDLNRGNVEDVGKIGLPANGEPPLEVFDEQFANRQYASVVPRSVFLNGRPAASALMTLPEQRLRDAPVLMASPQLAPVSAQQVVRATPTVIAPAVRVAVKDNKRGGKLVRTVAVQRQSRSSPIVVIHGTHLRAPAYAGPARGRQLIVLHVAQPHGGRRAHG
jgi:hypothetical protein